MERLLVLTMLLEGGVVQRRLLDLVTRIMKRRGDVVLAEDSETQLSIQIEDDSEVCFCIARCPPPPLSSSSPPSPPSPSPRRMIMLLFLLLPSLYLLHHINLGP